jgi:hypothetical protein
MCRNNRSIDQYCTYYMVNDCLFYLTECSYSILLFLFLIDDSVNICQGNPCSLCWPMIPLAQCNVVDKSRYKNITLKDITINNPRRSPGVIMGDDETKISGLVFDNVLVTRGPRLYSDPRLLFPGLNLPMDDRPLETGVMLLSAIVILAVVAMASCCVACRHSQKYYRRKRLQSWMLLNEEEIEASSIYASSDLYDIYEWYFRAMHLIVKYFPSGTSSALRQTLFTIIFSLLGLLCWWFVAILRMQEDITDYFACEGVSRGVAKGATWPVPNCFHDETNFTTDLHKVSASTSMIQVVLFVVGASSIWAASKAFRLFTVGHDHRQYSLAEEFEEEDCTEEYSGLEADLHLSSSTSFDEEDDIETTLRMNADGAVLKTESEEHTT